MSPQQVEMHKRRILIAIRVEANKREIRTPKPEKKRNRYSVKKYAGRYLPHEV